jgi:tetratricopeptide (TPR) repeat protein
MGLAAAIAWPESPQVSSQSHHHHHHHHQQQQQIINGVRESDNSLEIVDEEQQVVERRKLLSAGGGDGNFDRDGGDLVHAERDDDDDTSVPLCCSTAASLPDHDGDDAPPPPPPPPPAGRQQRQQHDENDNKRALAYADMLRTRNRFAEGLLLYDSVLKLEPRNVDALVGKGICLQMQSLFREAFDSFTDALRLDAQHACALTHCGILYKEQGHLLEAAQVYVSEFPYCEEDFAPLRLSFLGSLFSTTTIPQGCHDFCGLKITSFRMPNGRVSDSSQCS